jgi:hypothetical protein
MTAPNPLLWAGARAAGRNVTVSGVPNCLNYCERFVVYRTLEMWRRPRAGDPLCAR